MNKKFFGLLFIILLTSCNKKESPNSIDNEIINRVEIFEKPAKVYVVTEQIIDNSSDENLEQIIYEDIFRFLSANSDTEFANIEKLSAGQQMYWSTWIVEREVNNGGFNQFYFNNSIELGEIAYKGFKTLNAHKFADLMFDANKVFKENKKELEAFYNGTAESFSKSYEKNPLGKFDDMFYDLNNTLHLRQLRVKYIREHKNEFINR